MSCGTFYPTNVTVPMYFKVKCVSPGENGLCVYYLKGETVKGRITMVDSNNKYQLGDQFLLTK
jgi:hypothetical protein